MNSRLRFVSVLIALVFACASSVAQVAPKREFRGAWIATVTNIDWPLSAGGSSDTQRTQLTALLDQLAAAGINAVIFQIRPACDAFYASPYEPWSSWLTGVQGQAPADGFDPLQFAVDEAHKRGMELHAWFNPYRVKLGTNSPSQLAANNVYQQHPNWAIVCPTDGYTFLNPGLPQVRDFVAKVIADVVRRYDVDGVHMDDYFYPYPEHGFTTEDLGTFQQNPNGFAYPDSLGSWRRNNVNLLIKQIYDSVQAIRPVVKVGMSPFGIWKGGVPAGISGTSGYDVLYCDAVAWLSGKYIDYVAPQLYWAIGGGQDFTKLQPWWTSVARGRHVYSGIITSVGTAMMGMEMNFNRSVHGEGTIIFSARGIRSNSGYLADSLKYTYNSSAAVIPVMNWKDTLRPNAPTNLQATVNPSTGLYELTWGVPSAASDGEAVRRYLIYRFSKPTAQPADLEVSQNLLALTGQPTVVPQARMDSAGLQYYFAVTAFDRNNNESGLSNIIPINSVVVTPVLAGPANTYQNFARYAYLSWRREPSSLLYRVQVASSSDFTPASILTTITTKDTATQVGGLLAQQTYYWRVVAGNQGATGVFSSPWSFRTGWPLAPIAVYPSNGLRSVSRTPTFAWQKGPGTSYRIRVTEVTHTPNVLVMDQTTTDTTFLSTAVLSPGTNYSWIISASNDYGSSEWSAEKRFQTGQDITVVQREDGVPVDFALAQNYPNPFNPVTSIRFAVPRSELLSVRVYDVLGREMAVLVDGMFTPGYYTVQFNGENLSSGVYFYRLTTPGYVETKKMQLLK